MAHLIPSDISQQALAGAHSGELETLALLQEQLGAEFTVFHGVHWSFSQGGGTRFGEIDFIVVNRAGSLLCIEQKNGALVETDEGLAKVYGRQVKSVGGQIHRSLNQVREKFRWQHPCAAPLRLDYLLYCPDYRVRQVNASGLDQSRIVDGAASDGLARRIERVLGSGEPDPERRALVEGFFCQTLEVVPHLHAYRAAQERHFVRHTGWLAELIREIEMTPFRVRIAGTAGCGKSLLASVFAREQAAQGRRVLMVCFNRPLADRLQALLPEVRAVTFYGFCDQFLRGRGERLDYAHMSQPGFWREVQDRVLAAPIPEDWRFEVLIVDEGQDFEADWLEILRLFLTEDGRILWLEDPDQNVLGKEPVGLPEFVRLRSRFNYRSPDAIAAFMRDRLPVVFEPANPLPGLGVGVHPYQAPEDQPERLAAVVQELLTLGFAPADIAVVSLRGLNQSPLFRLERIGRLPLRRFTGDYQADGTQIWTEGELSLDTLYRFKGQEAPAIVLTDIDDQRSVGPLDRLLYCGMSRATVRLDLLVRQGSVVGKRLLRGA